MVSERRCCQSFRALVGVDSLPSPMVSWRRSRNAKTGALRDEFFANRKIIRLAKIVGDGWLVR